MRLVCPNCDAEYEVDGAAIPRAGRDVQCSNCGHAWFQSHPDVVAEQDDEEALFGAAEVDRAADVTATGTEAAEESSGLAASGMMAAPIAVAASATVAVPFGDAVPDEVSSPDPMAAPPADAVATAAPVARNIDESVLAVLREEAERESAARRAEAAPSPLETQTEMPLDQGAKPGRRGKPLGSISRDAALSTTATGRPEQGAAPDVVRSRRDLFPAIDEVNSTLRATSQRGGDETGVDLVVQDTPRAGGGFGRGLLTMVLIAVILLALYVFAPLIGEKVPALAGVAQAYVAAVNAARLWLDGEIKMLVGWLRGLEGGAQG